MNDPNYEGGLPYWQHRATEAMAKTLEVSAQLTASQQREAGLRAALEKIAKSETCADEAHGCNHPSDAQEALSATPGSDFVRREEEKSTIALLQDCLTLFNLLATDDDDNGDFQIDQNYRKQLDSLSEQIKTTI